jgi:transposase InsO family protein
LEVGAIGTTTTRGIGISKRGGQVARRVLLPVARIVERRTVVPVGTNGRHTHRAQPHSDRDVAISISAVRHSEDRGAAHREQGDTLSIRLSIVSENLNSKELALMLDDLSLAPELRERLEQLLVLTTRIGEQENSNKPDGCSCCICDERKGMK